MVQASPARARGDTLPLARTVGRCGRKKPATNLRLETTLRSEARDLLDNFKEGHIRCETHSSIRVQEGQPLDSVELLSRLQ